MCTLDMALSEDSLGICYLEMCHRELPGPVNPRAVSCLPQKIVFMTQEIYCEDENDYVC